MKCLNFAEYISILCRQPEAMADLMGSSDYSEIKGTVRFFKSNGGILVAAEIEELPASNNACDGSVFGFHIHSGVSCTGNEFDQFADAMTHYNSNNCQHPYHAGDMPPLFSNNGYAFMIFLTDRFDIDEIVGKTIIIHSMPDDFTSQPAGNSGKKIACGVIKN